MTSGVDLVSGVNLVSGIDHEPDHEHVLRPRPRKPQHSQLRQLTRMASDESDDKTHLATPLENGHASGATR
jgi:sterol O-acyltransferase